MPRCFPPCPSAFHPQTREYHVTFWSSFHYTDIATSTPSNYCIHTLKLIPKSKRYIETNQFKKNKSSPSYKKLSICVPELKKQTPQCFPPSETRVPCHILVLLPLHQHCYLDAIQTIITQFYQHNQNHHTPQ